MEMDLKVGDKAIIVNSKHHSKYNFQKCTVESINRDKVFVTVFGENYSSEFWLKRNELIPLIYENYEDCVKYGVDLKRILDLFNEYKGYYDYLCKIVDEISDDCGKKDEEIKSLKKQNNQLMDKNASLKEQLEYEQCKLQQIRERCYTENDTENFDRGRYCVMTFTSDRQPKIIEMQGELEKLRITVDVLSCRLAEYQKER